MKQWFHRAGWVAALWVAGVISSSAAVVVLEPFDSDPGADVADRDGIMTVGYNAGGYMTGSFGFQPFPTPQTDAFVLTGSDFTDDYAGLTQFRFQLYATDVAPSDLFVRFVNGGSTMAYQFASVGGTLTSWSTFTAPLSYSAAWGVNESTFNSILSSVDQVEIQLTRSGGAAQEYRLDNVQILDAPVVGGAAIPEPTTMLLMMMGATGCVLWRRLRVLNMMAGAA